MPQAIPLAVRRQIVQRHQDNTPMTTIADELGLSYGGVRGIIERHRQGKPLQPDYQHCGPALHKSDPLIYRAALWLKRRHPDWGAPLVRLVLEERYPTRKIASARTLQRWFKAHGLRLPRNRTPKQNRQRAQGVHEVWQVDAKERLRLDDRQRACYLTVADEKSGAVLSAAVFPPGLHRAG